mmetsp:Transcript_20740/g.51109  ORF Transcript_20740/g.51109 Transcript_20740/m.51109 type:complete len:112 (+) Transcript_20740:652-987(+)
MSSTLRQAPPQVEETVQSRGLDRALLVRRCPPDSLRSGFFLARVEGRILASQSVATFRLQDVTSKSRPAHRAIFRALADANPFGKDVLKWNFIAAGSMPAAECGLLSIGRG